MDLTLLAPDIQEQVINLEAVDGEEPVGERRMRDVVRMGSWVSQRGRFRGVDAGGRNRNLKRADYQDDMGRPEPLNS